MRLRVALLFALLATPALAQPADLVLRGGKVITVDKDWRVAQAVAIRDGRFIAIGDDAAMAGHIGPNTQVIELGGKTVIPGLIDTHLHQLFAALNGPAVQLLGARSVADVQKAIGERVARTEAGKWVMASSGWHESILEEGRMPTRHELDPVSPNNPVFIPRGGHVVTVNSKALELAGITKDTPNPEGGIIVRDASGEATGMLLQNAANLVRRILPPPPANMAELLKIAMADLNSYGIVGVVEPGVNEQQIALYRRVHDAGEMTVRTDLLYRAMRKAEVEKGIAALKAEKNSDMLRFVGIKFPLDGGVEGGRMTWPYRIVPGEQTDAAYRGVLLLPPGGEDEYVEGPEADRGRGAAGADPCGRQRDDRRDRALLRARESREADQAPELGDHAPVPPVRRRAEADGGARHHGDDAGSSGAARAQPAPLVGRRACRLRDPDPQGDRCRRAGRRRHRRAGGAGRSVSVDVVDDDAAGAEGLRARQGARDHREGSADALHHQQCAHHGRGEGPRQHRDRQARRPRGAVAGHSRRSRPTRSATPAR